MQFYTLVELCNEHFKELGEELPYDLKVTKEPIMRHGFCFYHETPYGICKKASKHFVYMVTEPVDARIIASARGGASKSPAKSAAARTNGAKGGRPSTKNPNLFKTANGLHILKLSPSDFQVIYADGSPAANRSDGSDAIFPTFMEAEIHAKSWRPNFVDCPACGTRSLHTNQKKLDCSNASCSSSFVFS